MSTEQTTQELLEHGVAVLPRVLDETEVNLLRACIDELRRVEATTTRQLLYTHKEPVETRPSFSTIMEQWFNVHLRSGATSTAGILGRLVERQLMPGMVFFQDVLLVKQPWHRDFAWHQDEPYWPWDAPDGLIFWCALDPVDQENGAVEFALGSHKLGRGDAIDLHTGETQNGGILPALSGFERNCPRLAPGDALLFCSRTWHRSGRNTSSAPRRAWSVSWLPVGARWRPDLAPRHPLAQAGQRATQPRGGDS